LVRIARDEVAVIAAHRSRRLIVIGDFPPIEAGVGFWQQFALDTRCQLEILLERALLDGRQVIEAELRQGVRQQAVGLDGVVARRAETECASVHAPQRGVDVFKPYGVK